MARKYDFNYGGARANYNQVAGVGQMVEQGLKRFGDMTQKIQDEETRLVTDAAFAEWRATGEVPQDLDPKVNLEQFQGLINDSLMNDKLDEEISELQYKNSDEFREFQRTNQQKQLELQEQEINAARDRAATAASRLAWEQSEAERQRTSQVQLEDMYRTFMPDISNLNDVAMDAADEGYMRYHAESALSTENPNLIAEISSRLGPEFEGQDITVPGPAREAAIAYYTSPEAGLVGEIAKTQEYKAGVAARYQQEYATALDNLQDRMRAATGGNPYLVQGMQTLLGGTGGGAGVGTGRGGIPNLGGGGISSAAMAMNVTTPGGSGYGTDFSKLTSAQLESIGLSKKDANDLDGLEGPVKLAVKKAQLEVMRGNFTGTPEQAAQYIWEAKARAERQVQTDEALLDGLAGGQLPSTIKPVNADSDVANFDFSKLTSESLEEQMPNTQFDTASRGTSVDAWVPTEGSNVDKINSFANYLENTVIPNSDVDEIQWDLLPNSSKKGISRFMNLYEDKFENNPDMFAHFMQSFVKDPANRKNTIMSVFGKNNLEYLYKLDPDNINKFYNAYMEELEANLKPKANTDSSRTPDEVNAALAWRLLSQQTKK